MAWYGWLIIVGVVAVAVAIIVTMKTKSGATVDHNVIDEIREKLVKEELEIERQTNSRLKDINADLVKELKKINDWYKQAQETITKEAQNEFEKLASDPSALDARLNGLFKDA